MPLLVCAHPSVRAVFRDSRGVVHTVSAADPLDDLPATAAEVLRRELLVEVAGDLGGALERCEAVSTLLDRWQDAFFAALPVEVDRQEEARWAAEAGLSLDELESEWEDDWDDDLDGAEVWHAPEVLEEIDLSELTPLDDEVPLVQLVVEPTHLPDVLVAELERALLLLPLRVRLEALVAAGVLVDAWAELLADHEKALGHLVIAHGEPQTSLGHEQLLDRHAVLHAEQPRHR